MKQNHSLKSSIKSIEKDRIKITRLICGVQENIVRAFVDEFKHLENTEITIPLMIDVDDKFNVDLRYVTINETEEKGQYIAIIDSVIITNRCDETEIKAHTEENELININSFNSINVVEILACAAESYLNYEEQKKKKKLDKNLED